MLNSSDTIRSWGRFNKQHNKDTWYASNFWRWHKRWENYIILNDWISDPTFLSRLKNSGAEYNKCNLAEIDINPVYNFKKSIAQVQNIQEYFRGLGNFNLTLHPQDARNAEKVHMFLEYITGSRSSFGLCNLFGIFWVIHFDELLIN